MLLFLRVCVCVCACVYIYLHTCIYTYIQIYVYTYICPTQSIMYIPFQVNIGKYIQVNIFQKSILLIVQYKYLKSCSEDLFSNIQQKSDPPHNIMRYFSYYSTQFASSFPQGRNLPAGNDLYHSCTSFEGASWRGIDPFKPIFSFGKKSQSI